MVCHSTLILLITFCFCTLILNSLHPGEERFLWYVLASTAYIILLFSLDPLSKYVVNRVNSIYQLEQSKKQKKYEFMSPCVLGY